MKESRRMEEHRDWHNPHWLPPIITKCTSVMGLNITTIATHMLGFILLLVFCHFAYMFLRKFSQPRVVSEFIVGLVLANLPFVRNKLSSEVLKQMNYIVDSGMVCLMFVVGLDINPIVLIKVPVREMKVAMAGFLITFLIAFLGTPLLRIPLHSNTVFYLGLSLVLSGTAYPLLTRLLTDLKIAKSDIGRFVITSAMLSDTMSILSIAVGFIIFDPEQNFKKRKGNEIVTMIITLLMEVFLAALIAPIIMKWVNRANPEGKPMTGSHLVLALASIIGIASIAPLYAKYSGLLSAFLSGLFMPKDGRISKMLINQVKYLFTGIFYPIFFFWVGIESNLSKFGAGHWRTWENLIFLFFITLIGKVVGSVVSGVILGFHWRESIQIGLLLSLKGQLHVYLALIARKMKLINISTSIVMVFVTLLTIIYTPTVVEKIIERARKRSPTQRMALQWHPPSAELQVLICVHGTQNVPSAINIMEISQGPPEPGIMVYLTDIVELTDKISATLVHEADETLTVTDPEVLEMRDSVTRMVEEYLDEGGEGVGLRRMIALSTMMNMHKDIIILGEDLIVSMIILPFHKDQDADGRLNSGNQGFRNINRKVLRNAPCSIGILVDRGFGSTRISKSSVIINIAVVFIGGNDDREALAFAERFARHPGVKLTVIRFLLDSNNETSVSTRLNKSRMLSPEHEEEMKLDDEYFADFYGKHVAGGHVSYMEKYLVNSGQTFSTLRSLEGHYTLFIVGRGGRVNSVLTKGMNDWEECPELGPIGDILSASDFSVTSSVLIIQQHSLRGELQGLQDEFSIM
ncbi:Cation/H(+) antiporter 28 [Heracleum sosnowskyi]|uniref:Cation/H(+) antiporter 28 n=1 Tax=Heracleum sosnowskyi TaxID=360622 RepID=A0AAD8M5U0_9APIA|nr:Cation/H(+) antiporter 28 [Heracleum sosnowskyi]